MRRITPVGCRVARALRAGCRGAVSTDLRARAAVAFDFGGSVSRVAEVVVRPTCAADVAHVARVAAEYEWPVAVRATGHTLAGQTQNDRGVVLDLRAFAAVGRPVRVGACVPPAYAGAIDVEPGAVWRDVIGAALPAALLPPVRTSNLFTTVGGTHAIGGLGPMSFRRGAQIDHCLGLEVVTPDGCLHWCTSDQNAALFNEVLGGLGQFGVVTRLRLGLGRVSGEVWRWRLVYRECDAMLEDLRHLAEVPLVRALHGEGTPAPRATRTGAPEWVYTLDVTCATADLQDGHLGHVCSSLRARRTLGPVRWNSETYATHGEATDLRQARPRRATHGHPWTDVLLPADDAAAHVAHALAAMPHSLQRCARVLVWAVTPRHFTRPLFVVPAAPRVLLVSVMPSVPRAAYTEAAEVMREVLHGGVARGGKRYPYGWGEPSERAWRDHFGPRWSQFVAAKARRDPGRRCNPQVLPFLAAGGPRVLA